jgi:hypothetical protein
VSLRKSNKFTHFVHGASSSAALVKNYVIVSMRFLVPETVVTKLHSYFILRERLTELAESVRLSRSLPKFLPWLMVSA